MNITYDVIVVGAGAGGGVVAGVLAAEGKRVLLLERGPAPSFAQIGRDHLRNQRLALYANNVGPNGAENPRVIVTRSGEERIVLPHEGAYQNNAAIVGGGTRVYGGQAWRFHPLDFKMASEYGVPEGSSLADWPLTYDDLAPYYERAEHEIGVAGDAHAMTHLPPYANDYPMPPQPLHRPGTTMKRGAEALGWHTVPVPLTINSVPRDGRAACYRCQHCVGFACPVDAKNGTQNTVIPRALATGNCTLITGAMVKQIDSEDGKVIGVTYFDTNQGDVLVSVRSHVVVVSGGAVETARLLLNSGLGNPDMVGRNLQGHFYPAAIGLFPEPVWDGLGPGASTAVCDFNHGNDGIIGGGMLADEFIVLPIIFWRGMLPPEIPRRGEVAKQWMRENYTRVIDIKGPIQEIPNPDARIGVDPVVRDRWGIPVARASGFMHPETIRTANFMYERAQEWLAAAGAVRVWGKPPTPYLSGGQHQSGTCRMGDDPALSVVDRNCRVHGHDNLYIGDGSVHVTNGGFNPVLTILALAFRTGEHIAKSW